MKNFIFKIFYLLFGRPPHFVMWKRFQPPWRERVVRWQRNDQRFQRREYSFADAMEFLKKTGRGSMADITAGTIPEESLSFICKHLQAAFEREPVCGLHIGNFLGVSLACITHSITQSNSSSFVVAVDPNIRHRGISNPQDLVIGLLNRYGLSEHCLLITGYSLNATPAGDFRKKAKHELVFGDHYGFSAGQVLPKLVGLGQVQFDFAVVDGNHHGGYLARELNQVTKLLGPGGLLILDDITDRWAGAKEVFETMDATLYQKVAYNGRVGILQKK